MRGNGFGIDIGLFGVGLRGCSRVMGGRTGRGCSLIGVDLVEFGVRLMPRGGAWSTDGFGSFWCRVGL